MKELAPVSDVVVIIDVLSFTTGLDIAVSRGASIFPYAWKDPSAARYAESVKAHLAASREGAGFSLSPASLKGLSAGDRLVLPSRSAKSIGWVTPILYTWMYE